MLVRKHSVIKIVSLTDAGWLLAQRLEALMVGSATDFAAVEVLHKPQPFSAVVQSAFRDGDRLIFICATGIVMRTLAPVIDSKLTDPAVLVIDERAAFVIPLLSGHEGGANHFGAQISHLIDAQLVSTTANTYLEPYYTAGMGCERHCPKESLYALLIQCLDRQGLKLSHLSAIASIDIKADEVGLIELAASLDLPFICYSAEQLRTVEDQLQTPSDYVFKTVGVYGVAESAALLSARGEVSGQRLCSEKLTHKKPALSELLLAKQKSKVATCALGRSYSA